MSKARTTALKICLGLGLGLLASEGVAWLVDDGGFPHLNVYAADAELGARLQPGARTRLRFRGDTTRIQINDDGYRGPDWGPAGDDELLIVGDSQVLGLGVEYDETHAAGLAAHTGRAVLNGGVPTYGPMEYRAVVGEVLAQREGVTDVVVVYNFGNDLFELGNPNTERHVVLDGWAVRAETMGDLEPTGFPGRSWLLGRSHLVFHARRLLRGAPQGDLSLPSEGRFEQVLAARQEGEALAQEQAGAEAERVQGLASAQRQLAYTDGEIATMLHHKDDSDAWWDALNQDTVGPLSDVIGGRFIESARPPTHTAALLLTGSRRMEQADEELRAWAEGRSGAEAQEVLALLDKRAALRAEIAAAAPVHDAEGPHSAFWTELVALRALCQEHGADLTVVALPLDVQVDVAEWDKYGAERQDLSETLVLLDALMQDAAALGVRGVDLTPALAAAQPGAFLDGDLHMTPKGHAAAAQALADALAEPMPMALPLPGLPEGRSRVPTWEEVRRLTESTVRGSSRNRCVTHHVREWLSIRCFVPRFQAGGPVADARWWAVYEEPLVWQSGWATGAPSWTPRGLTLVDAPLETLTLVRPGEQATFVMPLTPGRDASVDVHWSNRTEQLQVRWDGDTPQVAFTDRSDARAPALGEGAIGGRMDPGGAVQLCEDTWTDWSDRRACMVGDRTRMPECPEGQVNAGSSGHCFALCSDQVPCAAGVCTDWQGAGVCL
jgi:hypothetical protein